VVLSFESLLPAHLHPYRVDDKSTTYLAWATVVGQVSNGRNHSKDFDSHLYCHHHGTMCVVLDSFGVFVVHSMVFIHQVLQQVINNLSWWFQGRSTCGGLGALSA
jgi:hypothetical protein